MSEVTATMIEERNRKYLDELQGNIGKYLSFLSTMARFHKYAVADLTSFAIEAPAMFTAVASAQFWERHFRRKISPHAKGVTSSGLLCGESKLRRRSKPNSASH